MKKIILIGFVFLLLISSVLSFNTIEEARVDLEVYYNGSVHPTTGNAIEGKDGNGGLANFGNAASYLGGVVYNRLDQGGIDKALNLTSTGTDTIGSKVKLIQTGKTQQYIMYFLTGVIVISALVLLVL